MFVELSLEEAQLLSRLVRNRLIVCSSYDADVVNLDLGDTEIPRHMLERLEHRLHEAEWDVRC